MLFLYFPCKFINSSRLIIWVRLVPHEDSDNDFIPDKHCIWIKLVKLYILCVVSSSLSVANLKEKHTFIHPDFKQMCTPFLPKLSPSNHWKSQKQLPKLSHEDHQIWIHGRVNKRVKSTKSVFTWKLQQSYFVYLALLCVPHLPTPSSYKINSKVHI